MSDKREPMLSDAERDRMSEDYYMDDTWRDICEVGIRRARDFYEDLIDKGVLMVVKETTLYHPLMSEDEWMKLPASIRLTRCCNLNPLFPFSGNSFGLSIDLRCPGCGARIKHP